jgi:putative DNA primase/helicase
MIDFARRLGTQLDVPLLVVSPDPNPKGPEFYFPKGERDKITSADNSLRLGRWQPGQAILGVMGGRVAVVDVDPRNSGDVDRTRQMLDGLGVRIFAEVTTPGSGGHFYVAGHPELASAHNLDGWPGIDVQSHGALVFLPGTQRPKYGGAGYEVISEDLEALADGGDPDGAAAFAGWVAEHRGEHATFEPAPPWNGKRPDTRQAAYLEGVLAGMHSELVAMQPDSGRNVQLYNCALAAGNYIAGAGLDEDRAAEVLLAASNHNGLIRDDGQRAVLATIQSGIRNGKAHPRAVPEPEPDSRPSIYSMTDDGRALELIDQHGHKFRRVADMRRWFVWDGCRWALDHEDRAVRELARELARELPDGSKEEKSFKRNSLSATGISGATRVAETDPRVSIRAAELDAHPELLNTPTGVVDLHRGTLMPHDARLLLTRTTAHGVQMDAPHPRWDAFLAETFNGDAELIGYLQRIAGLALLGSVREHLLPFLYGSGANGKGVVTLVLQGLLGDADSGGYAVSAPDGFLMTGRDGKHETEIARLRGARLVVCAEQTSGKRFDESKVKRLTGGDLLTGRFMRGDFFDFPPSHLVWVLSNHLPAVREGGPSFWRRVRLIPFKHVVPEDQRVPDLHEQLLAAEGPAILGWAVRGAVEVLAAGLAEPEAVIKATEEYEISEDTLAGFVRDECLLGPHWWCPVGELRARYIRHCEEMEAEPLTAKALTMRLTTEYLVTSDKAAKGLRVYRGISLAAPEDGKESAE